jgi:hypothetical protein
VSPKTPITWDTSLILALVGTVSIPFILLAVFYYIMGNQCIGATCPLDYEKVPEIDGCWCVKKMKAKK